MPQCKLGNCREEAVPHGKRYCPQHLAEYKEKQAKHAAIQRTLPECASGIASDCAGKVGPQRHAAGETTCLQCERLAGEIEAAQRHEEYLIDDALNRATRQLDGVGFTEDQMHAFRNAFKELICDE